ncbi:ABC transporter permease [Tuanshanicoccus yangjingiae]|uniref:ABC transporter permease n=1 Tax=Aerococcaceae bacterium zg-252 TaxID=2796928 RepID=UPI0040636379
MLGSWQSIVEFRGSSFFLYSFSLGQGAVLPVVVPLIIALPFSNSYLQDIENNMILGILTRTTINKYYMVKILVNSLASWLSIIVPLSIFLIINLVLFPLDKAAYFGEIGGAWSFLFKQNALIYIFITILNSGLFAIVYSNLGFVSTLFVHHKLVSIVMPFIFYILPSFVFPFLELDKFEPVTTFDLTANTTSTSAIVYSQMILILLIVLVVGYVKIKQ